MVTSGDNRRAEFLQSSRSVARGRKTSGGVWQGYIISSCRFYKITCSRVCNVITKNLLKHLFLSNFASGNLNRFIRGKGWESLLWLIFNKISSEKESRDEQWSWNAIQNCRIQSFHHHKFICSLCFATKNMHCSREKETTEILFTFLNIIIKQNACTHFLRHYFLNRILDFFPDNFGVTYYVFMG